MQTGNFNLDNAINDHVQRLQQRGSLMPEDAAELSAHLYDGTESLLKHQLSTEEAFLIAAKRLGNDEVLHTEYSKVNMSINVNRIWSYMIIGFNLLYAIPGIVYLLLLRTSNWMLHTYSASTATTVVVTCLNLITCAAIIYAVSKKHKIAGFIEQSVEKQAVRTVTLSFLPLTTTILYNFLSPKFIAPRNNYLMISDFQSTWVEISFYLLCITFLFAALSLVVGINKFEKLTVKSLVEKPSYTLLFAAGFVVELLAASTRAIHLPYGTAVWFDGIFSALIFGLIYFAFATLIAYYNKQHQWRYLLVFASAGLLIETGVGISADLSRGGTYYTAFFVSGLIWGVIGGKFFGNALSHKKYAIT